MGLCARPPPGIESIIMRQFVSYGPALVVLLTAGAALLVVPAAISRVTGAAASQRVTLARAELDSDSILERINAATRNVADSVEPSVVHIDVGRWSRSSGSGWIYDELGHIVTNAHVVGSQQSVSVQLHDGRVLRGEVVASDPLADIAVIEVEEQAGIIAARRATGERVRQGDRVFAFGSPFGYKFSMSEGIVSGVGRTAQAGAGLATVSNFIQTDAAVNPGNSGGPLVDVRGRVVGMNVAIATAANSEGDVEGQSAGISFAIPLETIESRVEAYIAGTVPTPGFIGVSMDFRRDMDRGWGVRIDAVTPAGPADQAGLQAGDVITRFDGEVVTDRNTLQAFISSRKAGTKVTFDVRRGNETKEVVVTIGAMPEEVRVLRYRPMLIEQGGFDLAQLGDEIVIEVQPEGEADRAGLATGQRLRKIEGKDVANATEALQAFEREGLFVGRPLDVTVSMDGAESQVRLRLRR